MLLLKFQIPGYLSILRFKIFARLDFEQAKSNTFVYGHPLIKQLVTGKELPANYKPHELSGNYKHFQECQIKHDWLLIYQVDHEQELVKLIRTGTHGDLFE